MNGLDVAGLRPFDLVIPFTIQKGEITGNMNRHFSLSLLDDSFGAHVSLLVLSSF